MARPLDYAPPAARWGRINLLLRAAREPAELLGVLLLAAILIAIGMALPVLLAWAIFSR